MNKITEALIEALHSTTCKHQFEFIRHHPMGDGVVGRCIRCKCRFTSWPTGIHYDEILAAKQLVR